MVAYSGVCPHLAGPLLEGVITDGRVVCPWHRYRFDLDSGRCETVPGAPWSDCHGYERPTAPARLRLRALRCEVENDRVSVFDETA